MLLFFVCVLLIVCTHHIQLFFLFVHVYLLAGAFSHCCLFFFFFLFSCCLTTHTLTLEQLRQDATPTADRFKNRQSPLTLSPLFSVLLVSPFFLSNTCIAQKQITLVCVFFFHCKCIFLFTRQNKASVLETCAAFYFRLIWLLLSLLITTVRQKRKDKPSRVYALPIVVLLL